MSITTWSVSLMKPKTDARTSSLMLAVDVISSYGEVLEQTLVRSNTKNPYIKYPISMLPFSKNEIFEAIKLLKTCKDNLTDRKRLLTFLDKQQVEVMLSNKFSEQMSDSTVFLSDFIEDDKAKFHNEESEKITKQAKAEE